MTYPGNSWGSLRGQGEGMSVDEMSSAARGEAGAWGMKGGHPAARGEVVPAEPAGFASSC
jgi:hypothetical protein